MGLKGETLQIESSPVLCPATVEYAEARRPKSASKTGKRTAWHMASGV